MFKFLRRFLKEEVDEASRLQEQFGHFRHLLTGNNQALEIMADMEEKLSGDFLFDTGYLETQSDRLLASVSGMVAELNLLTDGRYPELVPICRRLREDIRQELAAVPTIPETPYVLPLSALNRDLAPAVGSKMANLGEIGNHVGLPVPQGFAVTAAAYKRFLEGAELSGELEARLAQAPIHDLESLETVSQEIQALIRRAPLPPELEAALAQAAQALPTPWLAVRSSAVGEDTEFSFAGQFATLLNVDAARLPDHYKEIVASKFTSRAIFYWKYQQFSVSQLPMAVGVLTMVPARASGVMFSIDPHAPEADTVLISAVWGLGKYAVDGTISPDLYVVSRSKGHAIKQRRVLEKPVALACQPDGGVAEVKLPDQKGPGPLPDRRPGPHPGGNRPDAGGTLRRPPGHRMDRGRGRQHRHPPVPAPPGEHPPLCRPDHPGASGGTGGAAALDLRRPGGGRRRGRPGPPLPAMTKMWPASPPAPWWWPASPRPAWSWPWTASPPSSPKWAAPRTT